MTKIIKTIIASIILALTSMAGVPEVNIAYAPDVDFVQEIPYVTEEESVEVETTEASSEDDEVRSSVTDTETSSEEAPVLEPQEPVHIHYHVADRVQAPTCTSVGYTYYRCECGDEYIDDYVNQLGHEYTLENAIIVEPTAQEMGYTRYHCSNCESVYDTNYVDYLSTIVFYEVNETVWANNSVNVRKGPGTDYDIVGGLEWSETVTRIGISDNGWSKVNYNGEVAYISSNYLQTSKPEPPFNGSTPSEEVSQKLRSTGATGILYIPSVGMEPVNVYLYRGTAVRSLQSIADRSNSAYMVGVYAPGDSSTNKIEFGDHVNHNFSVLKNIPVGTMAYFNMGDKVVRFKCVETIGYLSMSDYKAGIYQEDGMIVTTCCSGNGRTVNRWVITSDSDLTYEEFYRIAQQGEVVYWN